jgi:RES domain
MRKARDVTTLDLLAELSRQKHDRPIWRMARAGRNPLQPSAPKGRWDDGSFEVLYTAAERDGACAEMYYHLTRGQPVFPSQIMFRLYELSVSLSSVIAFENIESLATFGIAAANYGTMDYAGLKEEYAPTQKLAEAAAFLGADALLVPSARWPCQNVVLLMDNLHVNSLHLVKDHGAVDLRAWARDHNL